MVSSDAAAVLSAQVRWQHPSFQRGGIDQTQLEIADAPTEAIPFSFMVLGDTDQGRASAEFSSEFSNQLMQQFGDSRFLLHTGDVTYPIGSYQNYLEGFLRPYQSLLSQVPACPSYESSSVVFRYPFLPVPGNHDYANLPPKSRLWHSLLCKICDRLRRAGIDWGHYGGEGGEAYARAFLDDLAAVPEQQLSAYLADHYSANSSAVFSRHSRCLSYRPGQFSRLPNRYYRFRYAGVEFFALDSNTWNMPPDAEGFDSEQLDWLARSLIESLRLDQTVDSANPRTVARVLYLHHSPYTTEESRWQQPETLWVRKHLRGVLDRVASELDIPNANRVNGTYANGTHSNGVHVESPALVDLVLSGHAHCLEHVKTGDTGHADADMNWVVCGGSGTDIRRQRKNGVNILENISYAGRSSTRVAASSRLYAGMHGQGIKKQQFHSFLKVEVLPREKYALVLHPFVVSKHQESWKTQALAAIRVAPRIERYQENKTFTKLAS